MNIFTKLCFNGNLVNFEECSDDPDIEDKNVYKPLLLFFKAFLPELCELSGQEV